MASNGQPTPSVSHPYDAPPPGIVETMSLLLAGFRLQETQAAGRPGLLGGTPPSDRGGCGGAYYCRRAVPCPCGNANCSAPLQATVPAYGSVLELMVDQEGHRDFIRHVEGSNYERLHGIVDVLSRKGDRELVEVAKDDNGVRSLMSLVEHVGKWTGLFGPVACALGRRGTFELMKHTVGSRLVRHCLHHLKYIDNQFVFDAALTFCVRLAKNITGSESLIRCIDEARLPLQRDILQTLTDHCYILSTDKYGNYIIKHVVEEYGDAVYLRNGHYVSEAICSNLVKNLKELSRHGYASYVMQSCLRSSGGIMLLRELARMDTHSLQEISQDPYGNYVLQTALATNMDTAYHAWLVRSLSLLPKELLADRYAKNVLKCVKELLMRI